MRNLSFFVIDRIIVCVLIEVWLIIVVVEVWGNELGWKEIFIFVFSCFKGGFFVGKMVGGRSNLYWLGFA